MLKCTQRILLQNTATSLSPLIMPKSREEYTDYPVLFKAGIRISDIPTTGLKLELLDYSPHTVNTSVQQSTSHADGSQSGTGTSTSNTTGTWNSQSSTYGVTVAAVENFSGVTGSSEHSTSSGQEQSNTNEKSSSASASRDVSASASMSIKNWGAYAWLDRLSVTPSWVFGQEYPWNAVQCRYRRAETSTYEGKVLYEGKVPMTISTSMANNLYDGALLYPPSELSLYGLNFVMKATWRIYVDYDSSTKITIENSIDYYSASHNLSSATCNGKPTYIPNVYMDQAPAELWVKSEDHYVTPSTTLDLNLMALDPIGVNNDLAIVGFIPNRFIPLPEPSGAARTIEYIDVVGPKPGTLVHSPGGAVGPVRHRVPREFRVMSIRKTGSLNQPSWIILASRLRLTCSRANPSYAVRDFPSNS
jgi:hypothetical protein